VATTLVVTNDFPPRTGGIEGFVAHVCDALDSDVVVLTREESDRDATRRFDVGLAYEVVRIPGPLLPTPALATTATDLLRSRGATRVVYGAAAPLGLLAPDLRRAGGRFHLALSHGHEVWWAAVPGARTALRRIVDGVDHLGVISTHTTNAISAALPEESRRKLVRLPPPVDLDRFRPAETIAAPVVVAAGRLIPQKGFDALLDVWPLVRAAVPDARLLVAGEGPLAGRLGRRAALLRGVTMIGAVPYEQMRDLLRTARVFALPVRTRLGGLNPEGLGRVFLEAAACGLPVVVGRSGGAPETVVDGVTGSVVDPDDRGALATAIVGWLSDPVAARTAGLAGRRHVADRFGADDVTRIVRRCLGLDTSHRR
jgi:phosphatidylinositol alpha-1,6-mannosyltransferase